MSLLLDAVANPLSRRKIARGRFAGSPVHLSASLLKTDFGDLWNVVAQFQARYGQP